MNHVPPVSNRQFRDNIDGYFRDNLPNKQFRLRDKNQRNLVKQNMYKVYTRATVLFCIDLEAWERNTKKITEIGISIYDPKGQELALFPVIESHHISIKENAHLKNGRYVPDHSRNFAGTATALLPEKDAIAFIQGLFNTYFLSGAHKTVLVGHAVHGDINWLRSLGLDTSCFQSDQAVLDTQVMYAQSHGKQGASLKNALRMLHIPHSFLHNAGNDAYYTILLAMRLCDPTARDKLRVDEVGPEPPKSATKLGHNECPIQEKPDTKDDAVV